MDTSNVITINNIHGLKIRLDNIDMHILCLVHKSDISR